MRISRKTVLPFFVFVFLCAAISLTSRETAANSDTRVLSSKHKFSSQTDKPVRKTAKKSKKAKKKSANNGKTAKGRKAAAATLLSRETASRNLPAANQELAAGRLPARISSRAAIILDGASGDILFATSPDLPGQPASTIKVLTGLIAIDSLENDAQVSVSHRAAGMPRSKVYLQAGRSYRANDLINAVLLASANDASVALAERIGGSESTFAALMTAKARQLGATNTVCRTANGLTAPGQKSTPRDLAVMFNQIMKNQEFADRIKKVQVKTSYGALLRNHNRALWQVAGAEGGKTGYTNAAGQTYVGKFRRGQDELLVALMGSRTMWKDVNTLVEYGFANKAKLAAARSRNEYGPELFVQPRQLGGETPNNPLLVVLTDGKTVSKL